jgi:hypothetical protein
MSLQEAHNNQKRNCIHHGTHCDAINEHLGKRIPPTELRRIPATTHTRRRMICNAIDPLLSYLLIEILYRERDVAASHGADVGREAAFEELLPVVVGWTCYYMR